MEWPKGPAYKEAAGEQAGPLVSDIGWREFFTDEKLREVIELALENNRDLRIAALNIQKAQGFYRVQRAELFPAVNATGGKIKQRLPSDVSGAGVATIFSQYNTGIGLSSYELDFFGRLRSLTEAALQRYFATEQTRRSAQISLVASVANAYLSYAADCESLKLSRDTLESQEASYKLIQKRFSVGASSELDLRQAQTHLDAARVDIALFTAQVAEDLNALEVLAGLPIPSELLRNELGSSSIFKDITIKASSEVLLRRPDILQAEHQLRAANANIGAARAAFFPTILLTTNAGMASSRLSGLFEAGSKAWTFAPQVGLPIFDAGSRLGSLQAAKADRDIFLAQYEKTIQVAFREVADALAQRGTVGDQLEAQESLVEASAQAYRLSYARYMNGIDNYLVALDSQRSLYANQLRLISIRFSQLTNLVTLYKVLGGGDKE
jgi:multidrug efflux system outer membrane protein